MRLALGDPRRLVPAPTPRREPVAATAGPAAETRRLADFAGRRVHAVAGIGHPPRFFEALVAAGLDVIGHPFPDHHAFVASDFTAMGDAPVLMTGKDAVKCAALDLPDAWEVPVAALIPHAALDALDHLLRSLSPDVDP